MENLMMNDNAWRWIASPNTPIDYLKLCECGCRKAVIELNEQRLCKTCAIESGEIEVDDLD